MKTVISLAAAVVLALSAVPATAGDMFQALSTIPAGEQARLTALTDEQLAAIEGEQFSFLRSLLNLVRDAIGSTPAVPRTVEEAMSQNIGPTPNAPRNAIEAIPQTIGPTPNAPRNAREMTQQSRNTRITRQGR
jgi:hypothetical protein